MPPIKQFDETKYLIIFGKRLETLLKDTKTTKKQFAEDLGVTPKTVTSWTKGRLQPTLISLVKIVLFFRDKRLDKNGKRILPLKRLTPEIIKKEMEFLEDRFFSDINFYLKNHKK